MGGSLNPFGGINRDSTPCRTRSANLLIAMHRTTLTAAFSCGAIAVLCSGCLPQAFQQEINCNVLKDQFEWSQEMLSKGEVMFGLKTDASEAETKEQLKSNIEHYSAFWKEYNCPGSLTDPG